MEHLAPTGKDKDPAPLVADDMVIGIAEETSAAGEILRTPDPDQVLATAQTLIDRGARCLVIAFANSDCNPANERCARDIIKGEYPRDYLGSLAVFLASDIGPQPGTQERVNAVVLNGYIHGKLARLLYKAGEDLRRNHYLNKLFIGHNNGSVARVAKTRAINTYNSGPAAGLLGAQKMAALYGVRDIITTDMGGTSFDVGYVVSGQPALALEPDIEGFTCNIPMVRISAFGAGGGSIARAKDGKLSVGPVSAGAVPGPACFNLGGQEATLTDANLVLGILDPEYFLGGNMRLDIARATSAIKERIAIPLGVSVQEAACLMRSSVERSMGQQVGKVRENFPPEVEPLLIAYGGAGAAHACAIADHAGLRHILITPFSAVSSAFSSSLMDVGHQYYRRINRSFVDAGIQDALLDELRSMQQEVQRDMRGEGFADSEIQSDVQLFVTCIKSGREVILHTDEKSFAAPGALTALAENAVGNGILETLHAEDHRVAIVGLLATAPTPHYQMPEQEITTQALEHALKGTRSVFLSPEKGIQDIKVFARARLQHGHEVPGPAIVESNQTTLLIPEAWVMSIDRFNNALLSKK
jgi:N-methylhydantoinase A/acetophenone carboxylase